MTEEFFNFGYLFNSLKAFILNIIVPLCIPKSTTSFINIYFSQNWLKLFPWWYAIDIIPFLFVFIIFSYSLISSAASSGLFTFSAFSLSSFVSTVSLLTRESRNCFLISSWFSCFVFFSFSKPFHSYKQKMTVAL